MERDYRIKYRSREVDPSDADRYEGSRRRIPTALDPYAYPEDRDELKKNIALVKARNAKYQPDEYRDYDTAIRSDVRRDDNSPYSSKDTAKPGATKTTYAVTEAGLEKESEIAMRPPPTARGSEPADSGPSMSRDRRRERDEYETASHSTRTTARPYDDSGYARAQGRYEVERPRREAGGYVVDMRDADVIDVYSGAREPDRGFAGYRGDTYNDSPRDTYSRGLPPGDNGYRRNESGLGYQRGGRGSSSLVDSGGPYMSGARTEKAPTAVASRSQTSFREGPPRTTSRVYDEEMTSTRRGQGPLRQSMGRNEEDWGVVEKTTSRDVRVPSVHESFREPIYDDIPPETARGRGRASTFTRPPSEPEYVMVSPPREGAATAISARSGAGAQSLRSALMTETSYTPEERQRRRRSRSISFRDEDAQGHHAGEGKYHERPGAEAAMMGRYLRRYDADDDRMDYAYSSKDRRDPREGEHDYDRSERDSARYAPQRARSRSRRRREKEDDDYTSTYREKTSKTTYY